MIPSFSPKTESGAPIGSRMVDFCLALETSTGSPSESGSTCRARISCLLDTQPEHLYTLNQTLYSPLTHRPIGVSIETKPSVSAETGREQLCVWTLAWLSRIHSLYEHSVAARNTTGSSTCPPPPPLPLIRVMGHSWHFLLAVEENETLLVAEEMTLGETSTYVGVYKLLRAVQRIAQWMDVEFREWFNYVLLGKEVNIDK